MIRSVLDQNHWEKIEVNCGKGAVYDRALIVEEKGKEFIVEFKRSDGRGRVETVRETVRKKDIVELRTYYA